MSFSLILTDLFIITLYLGMLKNNNYLIDKDFTNCYNIHKKAIIT